MQSFHAELHQNKQHFELFSELTQKLIAVYPNDDTSRIKKMTEAINQRWVGIEIVERHRRLVLALLWLSFTAFNDMRNVAQFIFKSVPGICI